MTRSKTDQARPVDAPSSGAEVSVPLTDAATGEALVHRAAPRMSVSRWTCPKCGGTRTLKRRRHVCE